MYKWNYFTGYRILLHKLLFSPLMTNYVKMLCKLFSVFEIVMCICREVLKIFYEVTPIIHRGLLNREILLLYYFMFINNHEPIQQ